MPAESKAQFNAMQAAAHGHSTLGIPASVGKEFVAATPSPKALPMHAPSSSVEAMTGLPSGKKKVRRGGGRHKAKPKLSHDDHHKNLNAAMKQGDHASAKIHALHLANALHATSKKPKEPQVDAPDLAALL